MCDWWRVFFFFFISLQQANGNASLVIPLLRACGNLFRGPDNLLLRLVETPNLMLRLWNLLGCGDAAVLKELCWSLANLTGGPMQICAMLVKQNFVPPLAALFNAAATTVRKEIGFVFLNLVSALKNTPILALLAGTPGVMNSFVEFINLPDVDMIGMGIRWAALVLKYLPNGKVIIVVFLSFCFCFSLYFQELFEQNGGLNALEDLE